MRRREFIALFGNATAASTVWPRRARAQRRARIGVLNAAAETATVTGFYEILETQLGAADGTRDAISRSIIAGGRTTLSVSCAMPRSWCVPRRTFFWRLARPHWCHCIKPPERFQ